MNPFLQPDYLRFWDALAAPTLFIMDGEGEFRVSRKRVARGLASLRRLSLAADEHDWAVELTAQRLTRLNAFAERASWQYGQLLCYADDFAALWPREGILKNCRWRAMPSGDAYLLPIDQGYDSVLAGLTSKARCEIRRKEKKARALSSACRLLNHDGDWQTSLARFYDLHVAFWRERGQQSVFESPAQRECMSAWMREAAAQERVQFWGAFLADRLCSMRIGLRDGDTYYSLLTINTGDFAEHSPGGLLLQAELQAQCEAGLRLFHLGPGYARYKEQIGAQPRAMSRIWLAHPRSLRGNLLLAYRRPRAIAARPE